MMKNQITIFCLTILLFGCNATQSETKADIITTFYPLTEITQNIVGPQTIVYTTIPQGTEPHDYEHTPQDIKSAQQASVFVTLGLEFTHIEKEIIESAPKSIIVIDAAKNIALLDAIHEDEQETTEQSSGKDPHVWVSPKNMILMTKKVHEELLIAHPENKASYTENANAYLKKLQDLDQEFTESLSNCKKHTVLVNHAAFAYLAHDYGFEQIAISGLEPEAEPSPKQLAELIEEAKKHDIKYIFYEDLVDPRVSQTIAEEAGAKTLELSPVEGITNPEDTYISIMRENLKNLEIALECTS